MVCPYKDNLLGDFVVKDKHILSIKAEFHAVSATPKWASIIHVFCPIL